MEETLSAGAKRHRSRCSVLFFNYHYYHYYYYAGEQTVRDGAKGKTSGYKTEDETQRWQRHASLFTV